MFIVCQKQNPNFFSLTFPCIDSPDISIMAPIFKGFYSTNFLILVPINQSCSGFHTKSFCVNIITY